MELNDVGSDCYFEQSIADTNTGLEFLTSLRHKTASMSLIQECLMSCQISLYEVAQINEGYERVNYGEMFKHIQAGEMSVGPTGNPMK